jgi:hypothetical protein
VYLMRDCGKCAATRRWLESLEPHDIRFEHAELHPEVLYRVRYEAADGYQASGLAAIARVLERVDLRWAVVGWVLRVPVLSRLWQFVADVCGAGPRPSRGPGSEGVSCPVRARP